MAGKVLIIGGTGMLGLPVARQLKADGFEVTIGSSNPERAKQKLGDEFQFVLADVTDTECLRKAIDGFEYLHLNLESRLDPEIYKRIEIDGTANAARVASEVGVKRMSTITGTTTAGGDVGPIYRRAKAQAEKAIIESGVPYSIMRPSWFFETLPKFVQGNKAAVLGPQPHKRRWLAASDYARQVSKAYRTEEAAKKCFFNLGPQPLTIMEALEMYCDKFHPGVVPTYFGFGLARIASWLPGQDQIRKALPFFKFFNEYEEKVDSNEADRLLGPNLTTLEEWMTGRTVSHD